jgi:hypothetical protein
MVFDATPLAEPTATHKDPFHATPNPFVENPPVDALLQFLPSEEY